MDNCFDFQGHMPNIKVQGSLKVLCCSMLQGVTMSIVEMLVLVEQRTGTDSPSRVKVISLNCLKMMDIVTYFNIKLFVNDGKRLIKCVCGLNTYLHSYSLRRWTVFSVLCHGWMPPQNVSAMVCPHDLPPVTAPPGDTNIGLTAVFI